MFLPGAFDRAEDELRERAERLEENLNERDRTVQELRRTEKELHERAEKLEENLNQRDQTVEELRRIEGQIFADLYRPPKEQGFLRAIQECESLLSRPGQETNSQLWVYLAAAHGQAWKWENEQSTADSATKEQSKLKHRNLALEAVWKALEYGPTWKPALQMAWEYRR